MNAIGATWLDYNLVASSARRHPSGLGFGAHVREALVRRQDFLTEQGMAERRGQRVVLARNLLATLRERELGSAGKDLQRQIGKAWCKV